MRVDRIQLRNFGVYGLLDFNVSSLNPVVIVGPNGAGKSTLVKDSISWVLFGKSRTNSDRLIKDGQASMQAQVIFNLGGIDYVVLRGRERGLKTQLTLVKIQDSVSTELTGATIADTQEKIEQLIGVDYETFVSTCCVEQGGSDRFTKKTPKDAKSVLMNILRLDEYEQYLVHVRTKLAALEVQKSIETGLIQALEAVPAHTKIISKSDTLANLQILYTKRDLSSKELLESENSINDLMTVRLELKKLVAALGVREKTLKDSIKNIEKHESQLNSGRTICPLCQSEIDQIRIESIRAGWGRKISEQEQELIQVQQDLSAAEASSQKAEQDFWGFRDRITELNDLLAVINPEITELERLSAYDAAYSIQDGDRQTRLDAAKTKLEGLLTLISDYHYLDKAFGQNGIPALIVENVLPEIEASASATLHDLSNGTLRMGFRTQRELKSNGVSEDFTTIVYKGSVEREYDEVSGGERFRVDLALRIALAKVLSRRSGHKLSTLVIDEGMGSLDALGRTQFVELLSKLTLEFERIFVITHQDISDMVSNLVTVNSIDGKTTVKLPKYTADEQLVS